MPRTETGSFNVLKIRFAKGAGENQVEITDFVQEGWVIREVEE